MANLPILNVLEDLAHEEEDRWDIKNDEFVKNEISTIVKYKCLVNVLHLNIRSVRKNFDELLLLLET